MSNTPKYTETEQLEIDRLEKEVVKAAIDWCESVFSQYRETEHKLANAVSKLKIYKQDNAKYD